LLVSAQVAHWQVLTRRRRVDRALPLALSRPRRVPTVPSSELRMIRPLALAALAAALVAAPAHAQYATPRLSLEGNALYGTPSGREVRDLGDATGFDVQARLGVQAFSIGGGYLRTSQSVAGTSSNAVLAGPFVEPRLSLPFYYSSFTPYISGRLARLRQKDDAGENTGLTATSVGGGLGVLVRVAPAVHLNLAGTYQAMRFKYDDVVDGDASFRGNSVDLRAGLSIGFGK
jgi:opacity protein-like surface antigen